MPPDEPGLPALRRLTPLADADGLRVWQAIRDHADAPAWTHDMGDRVHADWQRTPGCGRDAMCDQIRSDTGESCGSRYYPRGVTAYLWLSE